MIKQVNKNDVQKVMSKNSVYFYDLNLPINLIISICRSHIHLTNTLFSKNVQTYIFISPPHKKITIHIQVLIFLCLNTTEVLYL